MKDLYIETIDEVGEMIEKLGVENLLSIMIDSLVDRAETLSLTSDHWQADQYLLIADRLVKLTNFDC